MNAFLIAAAVLASSGVERAAARQKVQDAKSTPAPAEALSDEEVRARAEAFLGAIDTAITPEQWRTLGPKGEPLLAGLAGNAEALPTMRAKAVDGLAALGGRAAPDLFEKLAGGEAEPLVVRLAALRGLGKVVPEKQLPLKLRGPLEGAKDARVRAGAAEVLAHRAPKAGCGAVRAQLARESGEVREMYHRAAAGCSTPARKAGKAGE